MTKIIGNVSTDLVKETKMSSYNYLSISSLFILINKRVNRYHIINYDCVILIQTHNLLCALIYSYFTQLGVLVLIYSQNRRTRLVILGAKYPLIRVLKLIFNYFVSLRAKIIIS